MARIEILFFKNFDEGARVVAHWSGGDQRGVRDRERSSGRVVCGRYDARVCVCVSEECGVRGLRRVCK